MPTPRPRLVVVAGALPADGRLEEALRAVFDVVEVPTSKAARGLPPAEGSESLLVPGHPGGLLLDRVGEGIGIVEASGRLRWSNGRLNELDPATRERFVEACRRGMAVFDQPGANVMPLAARPTQRLSFTSGPFTYELILSIADVSSAPERPVHAVIGMMWDVTVHQGIQSRIDAIDAAGSELMRIESASIEKLNMAERLRLLEEKIVSAVREVLRFDTFEIRLIDQQSKKLELVMTEGIAPLRIGEELFAEAEGNGISGYVAATGESYLCRDVRFDRLYSEGLENAASSLTVPLRLHERVIGVFNVESNHANAFDENDLHYAQILGRYIAMAMHILDLLVVERRTTNEAIASNVLEEIAEPLETITEHARILGGLARSPRIKAGLEEITEAVNRVRRRVETFREGPRNLIGADRELDSTTVDPVLQGKSIVLADNESAVRDAIGELLRRKGCNVTSCAGGAETIDFLKSAAVNHTRIDLVISDIRMPDRNGYEVFRTSRELFVNTPVILITGFGYDPDHSIVRANQEGLYSFLFKPLRADQLLETVSGALTASD